MVDAAFTVACTKRDRGRLSASFGVAATIRAVCRGRFAKDSAFAFTVQRGWRGTTFGFGTALEGHRTHTVAVVSAGRIAVFTRGICVHFAARLAWGLRGFFTSTTNTKLKLIGAVGSRRAALFTGRRVLATVDLAAQMGVPRLVSTRLGFITRLAAFGIGTAGAIMANFVTGRGLGTQRIHTAEPSLFGAFCAAFVARFATCNFNTLGISLADVMAPFRRGWLLWAVHFYTLGSLMLSRFAAAQMATAALAARRSEPFTRGIAASNAPFWRLIGHRRAFRFEAPFKSGITGQTT